MIKISYRPDKIVLITAAVAACIAALYSFLSPPVYRAAYQLSFTGGNISSSLTKDFDSWRAYLDAQCNVVKSKETIEKAIDKLHLRLSKRFAAGDPVSIIQKSVKVDHPKGADLININVYMDTPELASRIAQAIAESYLAEKGEKKFALAKEAVMWFKETEGVSKRIAESQEALNKFLKDNGIESFKEELGKAKSALDNLTTQRSQKETAAGELEKRIEDIEQLLKSGAKDKLYAMLKDSSPIYTLRDTGAEIERKVAKLKTVYEESHPDIVKLRKELEETDKNIGDVINKSLKSDAQELEMVKENLELLAKEAADAKLKFDALKEFEPKVEDLTRKLEINQKFYDEAMNKLKDGSFSLVEITNLGLVGQQEALTAPVGPKKTRNILIGLALGFILGEGISRFVKKKKPETRVQKPEEATKQSL